MSSDPELDTQRVIRVKNREDLRVVSMSHEVRDKPSAHGSRRIATVGRVLAGARGGELVVQYREHHHVVEAGKDALLCSCPTG